MEKWNNGMVDVGILVSKRVFAILILLSIPPVAGSLIQYCNILSEPEASTHYSRTHDSNVPEFQHSNMGEAPTCEIRKWLK